MITLRYGTNPHQAEAYLELPNPSPLRVLNGAPGYINMLDALTSWQLVRELKEATGKASAASYKHVSPAGAAIAKPIDEAFKESQFLKTTDFSEVASAYVRARGGDRLCSFGDVMAVSDTVDVSLAQFLKTEVCDAIIAPAYEPEALEILKKKRKGGFLIMEIDYDYMPSAIEERDLFGIRLKQTHNSRLITKADLGTIVSEKKDIPECAIDTLLVSAIALKYTQSNSISLAYDGQIVGIGAGQQSRIHCTRLACDKAEKWFLQRHPKVRGLQFKEGLKKVDKTNLIDQFLLWDSLSKHEESMMLEGFATKPEAISRQERNAWINEFDGIALGSDAFIPFRDNIDRASRTNVQYIVETGGSLRADDVVKACNEYGMTHVHTGIRSFLH
ncbi:phosphoribosylaminoimidazolecarboxamide formyltransferase [Puniceicoccaceae bacterium K14]|nr:phosphoribosylaminoimidazolecarboxamide formyltransferase [Puniceicoccaceae bacterium K14]